VKDHGVSTRGFEAPVPLLFPIIVPSPLGFYSWYILPTVKILNYSILKAKEVANKYSKTECVIFISFA
jgi:hypothetical protein